MTLKSSLKLTALGLGLASLAVTGCKGKDDDKKPAAAAETTTGGNKLNPQPVKDFSIELEDVPLGGCGSYKIYSLDEKGNKTDITMFANATSQLAVALTGDSVKRFSIDHILAKICTYNRNYELVVQVPQVGDEVNITVKADNLVKSAQAKVVNKAQINDIEIYALDEYGDYALNENGDLVLGVPVIASIGGDSSLFKIKVKNIGENDFKDLESAENVNVISDTGEVLTVKAVSKYIADDANNGKGKGKYETWFVFEASKKAQVGNYRDDYREGIQRPYLLAIGDKRKVINVNISPAEIKDVVFSSSTDNPKSLAQGDHQFVLKANMTDGTSINLSNHREYEIEPTEFRRIGQPAFLNLDRIAVLPNNLVQLNTRGLFTNVYSPYKLTYNIYKLDADGNIESLVARDLHYEFFVENIPTIINAQAFKTVVGANGQRNANADGSTIPVGGLNLRNNNLYCARIEASLQINGAQPKAFALNDYDFEIAEKDKKSFKLLTGNDRNVVCATVNANEGDSAEVTVKLRGTDLGEPKVVKISASKAIPSQNFVIMSADSNKVLPEIKLNQVTNKQATLRAFYIDSALNVTDKEVAPTNLNFYFGNVNNRQSAYFEIQRGAGANDPWTVAFRNGVTVPVESATAVITAAPAAGANDHNIVDGYTNTIRVVGTSN